MWQDPHTAQYAEYKSMHIWNREMGRGLQHWQFLPSSKVGHRVGRSWGDNQCFSWENKNGMGVEVGKGESALESPPYCLLLFSGLANTATDSGLTTRK